jgi:hypothetical protein
VKEYSTGAARSVNEPLQPVAEAFGRSAERLGELHLSARRLLVFVLMSVVFVLAARPISDPDFWWHLRAGKLIFETRAIPHADIFSSIFAGREWVAHEWLSEVSMYLIQQSLGYAGLVVCFALVISAAMWVAYRRCAARAEHPYVVGCALLLGALAASPTWGVRPQMFSFLFASIFLSVLDGYVRGTSRRAVRWLIPLTALWANMHAGFALGLALIALTVAGLALDSWLPDGERTRKHENGDGENCESRSDAGSNYESSSDVGRESDKNGVVENGDVESVGSLWRRIRPLVFVLVACLLAVALNPNGVRLYFYPFETLTSRAMMKYINEWFSPDFHELMFQPLALLLFATFAAMILSRERVRPSSLLLLAATGYAALRSGRNVPFFALAAMPLLAEHAWKWVTRQTWGAWLARPEKREAGAGVALKLALNILLFVAAPLALVALRVGQVAARQASDEARNFPVAAVEFMRASHPPQPVFNEYGWGGYMIWNLYPEYRVYIDGRADVYGDDYLEEFLHTHDGVANWRAPLEREGVRTALLNPNAPLASLLRQDAGWRKVFEDGQAVIFVRE